jgi:hypothetical protein
MNCLDRFGDEMRQLMDEYKTAIDLVNRLVKYFGDLYAEDVYLAGLVYSDCEKYRYESRRGIVEKEGFVGVCGDKVIIFQYEVKRRKKLHPIYVLLRDTYYEKLPPISESDLSSLAESKVKIMVGDTRGAYVIVGKKRLREIAEKLHISIRDVYADWRERYASVILEIGGSPIIIRYNDILGRVSLDGRYPQGFENSPIACATTDVATRIITEAFNLFKNIVNKGVNIITTYLLY